MTTDCIIAMSQCENNNRVPGPDRLQSLYCTLLHDVRVYTHEVGTRIYHTCLLLCSVLLNCFCCSCCRLLRHRVPDGKIRTRGSLHLFSVFFLFIQTRFFNVRLGSTVAFSALLLLPITHTYTSSVLRACAEPRRAPLEIFYTE